MLKTRILLTALRSLTPSLRNSSTVEGIRFNNKPQEERPDASSFDFIGIQSFDGVPGPRGIYALPFIGPLFHVKKFSKGKVEGLNDILHAYQQAYGDLFRFRIASRWIVVVSNPNLAKEVLSIRVKYPFRPEVEIVKMFGIRNNKEEGLGTLYDHFSKPVYT